MKTYQVIDMPKPGKEQGVKAVISVFRIDNSIDTIEIPFACNIEKVIILFGDKYKTARAYERLKKKFKK